MDQERFSGFGKRMRGVLAYTLIGASISALGCRDATLSFRSPDARVKVEITSPSDLDVVNPGDRVVVQVEATAVQGLVDEIGVFSYGALVDTVIFQVTPPEKQVKMSFSLSSLDMDVDEGQTITIQATARTNGETPAWVKSRPVTLTVIDQRPPLVEVDDISPPSAGSHFTAGESVSVLVSFSDPNSGVREVTLHVAGDMVATHTVQMETPVESGNHLFGFGIPYNLLNGRAEIWASARDASRAGNSSESSRTPIVIGSGQSDQNPPRVAIIEPGGSFAPEPGESFTVRVSAEDDENLVDKVNLTAEGADPSVQETDIFPDESPVVTEFQLQVPSYPGARDGDLITLTASASDSSRSWNTGSSEVLELRVTDKTSPRVSIVDPASDQSVEPSQSIDIIVKAQDENGLLDKIGISTQGALVTSESFDLDPDLQEAEHSFEVQVPADALCGDVITVRGTAEDDAANANHGVSTPLTLTVKDDSPPNVSIESPTDGTDVRPGETVQVHAVAEDINCLLDRMVLHVTGAVTDDMLYDPEPNQVSEAHDFQVQVPLLAKDAEEIRIELRAWDGGGLSSSAGPITLDVNDKFPPLVNILSVRDQDGRDLVRDYGSKARPGSDVTVTVSATDPNSGIDTIDFDASLQGGSIYSDSVSFQGQSPVQRGFTFHVPDHADEGGAIRVQVKVADSSRAANTFTRTVNLTVHEEGGPLVEILSPMANDFFEVGDDVEIDVRARDQGAGVARIEVSVTGAASFTDARDISPAQADVTRAFTFTVPPGAARNAEIHLDAHALDSADPPNRGDAARVTVMVANSPPSLAGCTISPSSPKTDDTLTCVAQGYSDPNNDPPGTHDYSWFVNGSALAGENRQTLSSSNFEKGDSVSCRIVPSDGNEKGDPVNSPPVTIGNSAPGFSKAEIQPASPVTGDDLTCTYSGYSDPDGDPLDSVSYRWYRNGSRISGQVGKLLPSSQTSKGQSIRCEAAPSDGEDQGPWVRSAPVVIANTPPELQAAYITPDPAYETSTLTCHGQGYSDADSDPEGYHWSWSVNGSPIVGATSSTLNGTFFDKGDVVTCTAVPFDGDDEGTPRTSPGLTISNSPPSTPGVAISPHEPLDGDDLTCTASGSTDPDPGDTVDYEYTWYRDGSMFSNTQTISAGDTSPGEQWRCEAVAVDDDTSDPGRSSAGTDQVLVAHARWTLLSVAGDTLDRGAYRPAVLDPPGNRLLLFGGVNSSDVLDSLFAMDLTEQGETWSRLAPGGSGPPARSGHSMITNGSVALVFGGLLSGDTASNETWSLDLSSDEWAPVSAFGGLPSARYGHSSVYYVQQDSMVVFGGLDSSGQRLGDVFAMDVSSSAWTEMSTNDGPTARYGHAAGYDPTNNCMVVFGGNDGSRKNDVWTFTLDDSTSGTWTQAAPSGDGPPSARQNAAATIGVTPDLSSSGLVVFGGGIDGGRENDTWILADPCGASPSWIRLYTHGGPPQARDGASIVYDVSGSRLILVGGRRGGSYLNDVWELK